MFTRVNRDANGNSRYVCHFLELLTASELAEEASVSIKYEWAIARAKTLGGKKYRAKEYGGIVFQNANLIELEKRITEVVAE